MSFRFLAPRLRRAQIRHANLPLIVVGMVLLPTGANAGFISVFNLEAVNGPFPATVTPGSTLSAQQSVTIMVASDPSTMGAAELDYSVEYTAVTFSSCTFTGQPQDADCSGSVNYQVSGPTFDSGISGAFSYFTNGIQLVGQPMGVIDLSAGIYTFSAIASSSYGGPAGNVIEPNATYGGISADFTVVEGDVSIIPEPGTMALFVSGAFAWLGWLGRHRRYGFPKQLRGPMATADLA